jgi:hypothetical protein
MYAYLEIYNGGKLKIKAYDKRDEFTFPIVNYPFFSNNIRAAPANGVYI